MQWSNPKRTHLGDAALVALVDRRDADALGELYDRFGAVAYRLARRIVRDSALAEDVVQEAFHDVWRFSARFDPTRGNVATWLLTIVHRRAVDLVRREERRPVPAFVVETHVEAAADELWRVVEGERVRIALDRLPAAQREAIELAYYEGLTQREVAIKQDVPLGTVKSRMFAALASLAELLDESPPAVDPAAFPAAP